MGGFRGVPFMQMSQFRFRGFRAFRAYGSGLKPQTLNPLKV